jgi:hypothetical protein
MKTQKRSIRLAGKTLEPGSHVCAFFNSREEEYQALLPFIRDGFHERDRAFHIVDPRHRQNHLDRLRQAGILVEEAETLGQLEICNWEDAYLRGGRFDQDKMLALIEEVLQHGQSLGFPLTRLVAHMEWALEQYPGVHDLAEYEARLNYLLPHYEDPVLCVYDLSRFRAETLMDVLRVHSFVILGGILHENPFYTPPDAFLRELEQRSRQEARYDALS